MLARKLFEENILSLEEADFKSHDAHAMSP